MERRTFLVLSAAVVGLAGCTSDPSGPRPPSAPPTSAGPSDPDRLLREDVAQSEVALIAAYRSAIQADPELLADLAPFLAQHEAHLARVAPGFAAGGGTPSASTSASTSTSTSPSPTASPSGSGDPTASPSGATGTSEASTSSLLTGLAQAETVAQAQRTTACDGAQDPGLARDLCLIAASEAQHAAALEVMAAEDAGS